MSADIDDEFFLPESDTTPTPPRQSPINRVRTQVVQNIQDQVGQVSTPFVDEPPIVSDITPPPPIDDGEDTHPFEGLRSLITRLETVLVESSNRMDDVDEGARWAAVTVSGLREARMLLQVLLPKWDEMQSRRQVQEESWVDHLMDFNIQYVIDNLGEDMIADYMEKWDKFQSIEKIEEWRDNIN